MREWSWKVNGAMHRQDKNCPRGNTRHGNWRDYWVGTASLNDFLINSNAADAHIVGNFQNDIPPCKNVGNVLQQFLVLARFLQPLRLLKKQRHRWLAI